MEILKQESKYTKISIAILCFLSASILTNILFNLPIRMSRICWFILACVSLVVSVFGKKKQIQ